MGEYPAAARLLEEALSIFRDVGDQGSETEALNERGTLHRVSGDLAQAKDCHQQALELARATACLWDEAHALAGLGRCAIVVGHLTRAGTLLRQALEIFQQIGAAEAPHVLAELNALTSQVRQDKP
jgi:tetratricopeptide (TPR) repeat protein